MASILFIAIVIFLVNFSCCLCVATVRNNATIKDSFEPALATWYGDETGAGSGNEYLTLVGGSMIFVHICSTLCTLIIIYVLFVHLFLSLNSVWHYSLHYVLMILVLLLYAGGACGWENDVKDPPLSAMISAGNAKIFLNGKGCGHCFEAC